MHRRGNFRQYFWPYAGTGLAAHKPLHIRGMLSPLLSCMPSTALAVALLPPIWTCMASTRRPSASSSSRRLYFCACNVRNPCLSPLGH